MAVTEDKHYVVSAGFQLLFSLYMYTHGHVHVCAFGLVLAVCIPGSHHLLSLVLCLYRWVYPDRGDYHE